MLFQSFKTSCLDWSLNTNTESDDPFWWNNTYSISIWERSLGVAKDKNVNIITDTDVWEKYIEFQINNVFKMCPICCYPEGNEDMKICCYCGGTVHMECSVNASPSQTACKQANMKFETLMRVCAKCHGNALHFNNLPRPKEADNLRRVLVRVFTLKKELSLNVYQEVLRIAKETTTSYNPLQLMAQLKSLVQSVFQSKRSLSFLKKEHISNKCGGIGVVAAQDIPQYSIIGVYPGYIDTLSGEQTKFGRPSPKYALMDLNCADFYNNVFVEFEDTFTPFINEPNEAETSNCAWIQESNQMKGRLSIISVKEIRKGEELLIGYGPIYARNYSYRYDAYAFHHVEGYDNPCCYALWHWPTLVKDDAIFIEYIGYLEDVDKYIKWETMVGA